MSTTLHSDAIQRTLFQAPTVHVYTIPPLTSTKGYNASSWTQPPSKQIFTARLRILETATPNPPVYIVALSQKALNSTTPNSGEKITTSILLEDPSTNDLFAEAPYTSLATVSAALDSTRFFALRVVGDGGRKATLGIGFEERSEAFDFGIALAEAAKVLGFGNVDERSRRAAGNAKGGKLDGKENEPMKRDWKLKEGESIRVEIGGRGSRRDGAGEKIGGIAPPSGGWGEAGGVGFLPPPPSAGDVREKRKSREVVGGGFEIEGKSMAELGFDDGEFGEFQ